MFHSAGYFKGVLCPFYEHELCHRPHCHFKHSKPDSASKKATSRPPPQLRTTLHRNNRDTNKEPSTQSGHPSHGNPSTSSGESLGGLAVSHSGSTSTPQSGLSASVVSSSSSTTVVPDVAQAVGKIANYFGSCSPVKGVKAREEDLSTNEESQETFGAVSAVSSEENVEGPAMSVPSEASSKEGSAATKDPPVPVPTMEKLPISVPVASKDEEEMKEALNKTLPSYAPEKCIAQVEYSKNLEPGLKEVQDLKSDMPLAQKADNSNVVKLKEALVTEKDIFGSDSHDSDDAEDGSPKLPEVNLETEENTESTEKNVNGNSGTLAEINCTPAAEPPRDVKDMVDVHGDIGEAKECDVSSPRGSDDALDCEAIDNFDEIPSDSDEKMGPSSKMLPSTSATSMNADQLVTNDDDDEFPDELENMVGMGGNEEYSKEDQRIMEEFQKMAAMEDTSEDVNSRKRKLSSTDELEIPVKKKRIAHPQAKNIGDREPARVTKAKIKDTNFSSMLKQSELYMGKKRTANKPMEGAAIKRPRLPLVTNPKIPTKIRQGYLDKFIDEYMNMGMPSQEAYRKGIDQEKTVFEQCNGKNVYLNKSYGALKILKEEVLQYSIKRREASDERLRKLKDVPTALNLKESDLKSKSASVDQQPQRISSASKIKTMHTGNEQVLKSFEGTSGKQIRKNPSKVKAKHSGSGLTSESITKKVTSPISVQSLASSRTTISTTEKRSEDEKSRSKIRHENADRKSESSKSSKCPVKTLHMGLKFDNECSSCSSELQAPAMDLMALESEHTQASSGKKAEEQRLSKLKMFYGSNISESSKKSKDESSKVKRKKHKDMKKRPSIKLSELDWIGVSKNVKVGSKDGSSPSQTAGLRDIGGSNVPEGGLITKLTSHLEDTSPAGASPIGSDSHLSGRVQAEGSLHGSKSKPSSGEVSKSKHKSGELQSPKYSKLSLKSSKMKQFTSSITGESNTVTSEQERRVQNKSDNFPTVQYKKSVSVVDLTSQLFGSDEENSNDAESKPLSSPSMISSKKFEEGYSSSEDSSSSNDCFVVDCPSSRIQKSPVSRDRSPIWSSDDDDWSAMKSSFESALNSFDSRVRKKLEAYKSRTISLAKKRLPSKERLSIDSMISKVPSVNLSRNSIISSTSDEKTILSRRDSDSSMKEPAHPLKNITKRPNKLVSSENNPLLSCSKNSLSSIEEKIPAKSSNSKKSKSKELSSSAARIHSTSSIEDYSPHVPIESKKPYKKERSRGSVNLGGERRPSISSPIEQQSHTPVGTLISLSSAQERDVKGTTKPVEGKSIAHKVPLSKGKVTSQQVQRKTMPKVGIVKKKEPPPLTKKLFFSMMTSYVLTEQQLHDCGYPRPSEKVGTAAIFYGDNQPPKVIADGPNFKTHECNRCHKPFSIYNNGLYKTTESCSYHYGRPFKVREYGEGMVSRYSCCQERSGTSGCQTAKFHVTAGEALSEMPGYVTTLPHAGGGDSSRCVYALDCEMCYTTVGLELTRVSVVDMTLQPVYEAIVKPQHTIVDYNTRFSGLTAKDFTGVTKSQSDVQEDLLKLFSNETILLGHSLESDMRALRIIHGQVVDTAIVFPHRMGLPYKRALKTLTKEILHKFIQNDVDEGHDSLEDSRACMELMLWKINGDRKSLCRRTINIDS